MKFIIDIEKKELIIHGETSIRSIIEQMNKMFPNKEWMDWTLNKEDTYTLPVLPGTGVINTLPYIGTITTTGTNVNYNQTTTGNVKAMYDIL